MADELLSVQGCSFSYGPGEFELHDVTLGVRPREVLGLVGPNGSGKSTLLRVMSGLVEPHAGRVLLDGAPLRPMNRRAVARRLAFLPQEPTTAFRYRTREIVAMGRYPYLGPFGFLGESDVRAVESAMARTETAHLADRVFSTLSGGEKQRALVAAVLAQEPSVMLLDEPTAALDIHHQCDVLELLRALARGGMAVVIVTHDLNGAARFCDRLALLAQGRARRVGRPEEVLAPDLLGEVYEAQVRVVPNPVTGTPLVVVTGGRDADGA